MNGKTFCVQDGYILTYTANSAGVPGTDPQVAEIPAAKLKSGGNAVLVNSITAVQLLTSAAPCVMAGGVFVGGTATISATAAKCKTGGMIPLRDGDFSGCVGGFTVGTAAVPCACTIEIKTLSGKIKGA